VEHREAQVVEVKAGKVEVLEPLDSKMCQQTALRVFSN
jgi:hypothetical protein